MKVQITLFACAAIALSATAGATERADITARTQLADGSETTAHAYLERSETARLKITSDYSIDLTYRHSKDNEVIYEYRFLQWNGQAFTILHTATRQMAQASEAPVGYVVCGDGVMFVSHPEETMPACLGSAQAMESNR